MPMQSQAPPMFSKAPPKFVSQAPAIPPPVLSQPPPLMNQALPPLPNQALSAQCIPTMQPPPPNVQFNVPPPGYIKQEQIENQEEYTTVMGDYGPVLVKKSDIKQEAMHPCSGYGTMQSVEKNENDYDPAMPTEGDSPGKNYCFIVTLKVIFHIKRFVPI